MSKTHEKITGPFSLTATDQGLKKLLVGCGWEFNATKGNGAGDAALDIDLCCFILGRDNLTREDQDFVFYNNPQGAALAVKHLGDNLVTTEEDNEAIIVDFDNLSFDIWRIVFVVSIYQGTEHDMNFGQLKSLILRAENAETNVEVHRFAMDGAQMGDAASIKVAEIYRNGVEWFFEPMAESIPGGLSEVAKSYGLLISSTT